MIEDYEEVDDEVCELCGGTPVHISVYDGDNYDKEILICRDCYEEEYL